MRALLSDVRRNGFRLADWWVDLPMRHRWWWHELLFQPGAGWLRWKGEMVDFGSTSWMDPPDMALVLPPAQRLWLRITQGIPFDAMMDPERPRLYR